MLLYHGSTDLVSSPEIRKGDANLDFGDGFYTTTAYEQAERWARIKMKRSNTNSAYISRYDFDTEMAEKSLEIERFNSADERWLMFVVNNRGGFKTQGNTDMHVGPVADDNIYRTIRLFETGAYDVEYTLKRLKTEVLIDQWTFHTSKAISFMKFINAVEVGD